MPLERRNEFFNLTTHSTFYSLSYVVGHTVKDHLDSKRGNPLPPHGLFFLINLPRCLLHQLWSTGWNEK